MIRQKIKCEICGEEISKSNMSKHLRRHKEHPETFEQRPFALTHSNSKCQFCGKEFQSRNALCNHERLCNANPNGQISAFTKYNKEHDVWNKGLTVNTSDSVRKQSRSLNNGMKNTPIIVVVGSGFFPQKSVNMEHIKDFIVILDGNWLF